MTQLPENVELIIGLEIHVQLQTETKLFCGCATKFGQPANTLTCPVCLGLPGALPVVNRRALNLSIATGLGLGCAIAGRTRWDRKNYFYPDLPKGYQISQLDQPICGPGQLAFSIPKKPDESYSVRITRAHLEEDAGKSIHDDGSDTKIDLNRAGTPLLEIVTEPDLRTPEQARAFLTELKLLLTYLEVSDCNMQQGNLRVDANVNLAIHEADNEFRTPIVEIKNMNSFRAVERALIFESERQWEQWQLHRRQLGEVPKATRGWDDKSQTTILQREKEEAADYRYFPDPDLAELEIKPALVDEIRSDLPERPAEIRQRFQTDYPLSDYDIEVMVSQGRGVVQLFEELTQRTGDAKISANWVTQEVLRWINDQEKLIVDFPIPVEILADLIKRQVDKELDQTRAKLVFEEMLIGAGDVDATMAKLGIKILSSDALVEICDRLIRENESVWNQVLEGNTKAVGALIGAAKKIDSNIDAGKIRSMLIDRIPKSDGD